MLNIQCKATEATPPYQRILKEMPQDEKYNVIFQKRNKEGEIVVISKEDFYELLQILITEKLI